MEISSLAQELVFDLSYTPHTVPFFSETGSDLYVIARTANHLWFDGFDLEPSSQGSVKLTNQPADFYVLQASNIDNSFFTDRVFESIPQDVTFRAPNFSFANNPSVDEQNGSVSWSLQDATSVDQVSLILNDDVNNSLVHWDILVSGSLTTLELPDLPTQFSNDFAMSALPDRRLTVIDIEDVDGFENSVRALMSILETSDRHPSELILPGYLGDQNGISYDLSTDVE